MKHTGEVFNDVFGEVIVSFSPIINYYPFDYQNITFTFGSSSYDKNLLPLSMHKVPFIVMSENSFN